MFGLIQVLKLTLEFGYIRLQVIFDVGLCLLAGPLLTAKGRRTSSQAHAEPKKDIISFQ